MAKQKEYSRDEILTIKEVVYNMRAADDGFPIKMKQPIKDLSVTGCKAVIMPAAAIRTYKRDADYILITDYNSKEK